MEAVREFLINERKTQRDAVMFDIDDTLIDVDTRQTNQPIVDLLFYCKNLGYKVIIITARPYTKRAVENTKVELRQHRIFWDGLLFTPAEDKGFIKRNMGYRFVLSVGDRMTDVTESLGYIKLPDDKSNRSFFVKNVY